MMQRTFLRLPMLACLAALGCPTTATAVPLDPPPAGTNWTGLFVGLHGGYGWGDANWVFPEPNYYTVQSDRRLPADADGRVVGGQIGFNRQFGALVWGIELSVSDGNIEHATMGTVEPDFYPFDRFTTRIGTHGTLTGRVGYALDTLLLYGRGGFAAGRVSLDVVSGDPEPDTNLSGEKTLRGWTLGGGMEYMFSPRISLAIQYDFIRLDGKSYDMVTTGTSPGQAIRANSGDIDLHTATARLNIRLMP